jgi:hypothetical protein
MLRVPEPADAVRLGLWITHDAMRDHGSPAVRVGLHHGHAIERNGDYFGASVNLAARVSSAAAGGEVLVTGQTAALVPDLEGVIFESRGRKSLRNVSEPVDLFSRCSGPASQGRGISRSTRCVGWQSIPNAHQGSSRTRVRRTSSARSRVQECSRRTPRFLRPKPRRSLLIGTVPRALLERHR